MKPSEFKGWCCSPTPKPLIMGILNITPDSFYDGGQFLAQNKAFDHAQKMIDSGADIIDIGGESSRPGATDVSVKEELARIIPVIEKIRQHSDICISVDTTKALVMQHAYEAGASIINDICALQGVDSLETAVNLQIPVCLMHMQGIPATMQNSPYYTKNILDEINDFFYERINICENAGLQKENIIIDPGFGFGKTITNNLDLIKKINVFKQHGRPILLGVSRKNTIGCILNKSVDERLYGSIALSVYAVQNGVGIIRTHDVHETKESLEMINAIINIESKE